MNPGRVGYFINGAAVAGLTVAGIFALLRIPPAGLAPIQWGGEQSAALAWFLYTIALWAIVAGLIAACMLVLKPRNVLLYGAVSAMTFVITMQSWGLIGNAPAVAVLREVIFILTIPLMYLLLDRLFPATGAPSASTHQPSLDQDSA